MDLRTAVSPWSSSIAYTLQPIFIAILSGRSAKWH